jgi:hypothetical protein
MGIQISELQTGETIAGLMGKRRDYFAVSVNRLSRIMVTLISPG